MSGPENQTTSISGDVDIDFLHEIGKNASSVPLSKTLARVAVFVSNVMRCDSCFVYLLDGRDLVMRASKNPHKDALDRLKIQVGQGITGWVAEHKQTAAIAQMAYKDARFKTFNELPEDRYEAFLSVPLLCRDKVIGVINVQHRQAYFHTKRDIQLISTIGFLVAAEIEMARLEAENWKLNHNLQARNANQTPAAK